jgi:LAO/AO transport system kinase
VSALHREGIAALWTTVLQCRDALAASGELQEKRTRQALAWTWHLIDAGLRERFRADTRVREALPKVLRAVAAGTLTPTAAAEQLLSVSTGE